MFDPWTEKRRCQRSIYFGDEEQEIRIWGRRRFHVLERLVPIANHFDLHLLGRGMPYHFVVPLQEKPVFNASTSSMTFTLGLSSWSTNSFSRGAAFDLMQSKVQVPLSTMTSVYWCLKKCNWTATPADISKKLGLDRETVILRSLPTPMQGMLYTIQISNSFEPGSCSRDPRSNIFEPSPAEKLAQRLIDSGSVQGFRIQGTEAKKITGYVRDYTESESLMTVTLSLDPDGNLIGNECHCTCKYFTENKLRKGPCEHLIAIKKSVESDMVS